VEGGEKEQGSSPQEKEGENFREPRLGTHASYRGGERPDERKKAKNSSGRRGDVRRQRTVLRVPRREKGRHYYPSVGEGPSAPEEREGVVRAVLTGKGGRKKRGILITYEIKRRHH